MSAQVELGRVQGLLEAASLALQTIPTDKVIIDKYLCRINDIMKLIDAVNVHDLEKLEEIREMVGELHLLYFGTFIAASDEERKAIIIAFRALAYADVYLKYVLNLLRNR